MTLAQDEIDFVRKQLEDGSAEGSDALIDFANRFAYNPRLKHRSLLLSLDLSETQNETYRQALRDEMLALVAQVVEDHNSPDPKLKEESEELQEALKKEKQAPPSRQIAFSCRELGHSYRKNGFRLHGVDLDLRMGEITGVVGKNANGKTTLFRMIAGELRHTEGTLSYPALGAPVDTRIQWAKVKQQIAYVPQILPRWYGSLRENLSYSAATHGIRGQANLDEVAYIVERLDLTNHLEKRWGELSGGYRLRFELASALVWRPHLLILDEPLANLDFEAQLTVLRDIRDLARSRRKPIAVVMSSQHLHEVEAVAENILFLSDGAVRYHGPTAEIGADRDQNVFELGTSVAIPALRQKLRGLGIERISTDGMSYIIEASLSLHPSELLRALLDAEVPVTYFRDVSRSIKGLFDEDDAKLRGPKS